MPINEYDEILQNGNERQGSVNEYDSFIANENESAEVQTIITSLNKLSQS